jgi:hypothetical protein
LQLLVNELESLQGKLTIATIVLEQQKKWTIFKEETFEKSEVES